MWGDIDDKVREQQVSAITCVMATRATGGNQIPTALVQQSLLMSIIRIMSS